MSEIAQEVERRARGRAGARLERGRRQASQRGRAERPRAALDGPLGTGDRGATVPLPQHGQDAPSVDLRQARRAHPRRRDRTGDGSSPVRGRSFTQVISGRAQPTRAPGCMVEVMGARTYSLVVEGELSARMAVAFEGMSLSCRDGRTTLTGPVRDQSELPGAAPAGVRPRAHARRGDPGQAGDGRRPGLRGDARRNGRTRRG